jgi:hypothetical protein
MVDGRLVAQRKSSVLNAILRSGWPTADDVVRGMQNAAAGQS